MPIPTTDEMISPVLQHISDGQEYRRLSIINMLTAHFSLTEDERRALSKSGQMEKSLSRGEFIERSRKGHYRITSRGLEVLNRDSEGNFETEVDDQPLEGVIEENYQKIREGLATELLQQIKDNTSTFFEELVKVILIDGNQLAQLMIGHNVGVSTTKTYEIKRVDSDYFAENAENS